MHYNHKYISFQEVLLILMMLSLNGMDVNERKVNMFMPFGATLGVEILLMHKQNCQALFTVLPPFCLQGNLAKMKTKQKLAANQKDFCIKKLIFRFLMGVKCFMIILWIWERHSFAFSKIPLLILHLFFLNSVSILPETTNHQNTKYLRIPSPRKTRWNVPRSNMAFPGEFDCVSCKKKMYGPFLFSAASFEKKEKKRIGEMAMLFEEALRKKWN